MKIALVTWNFNKIGGIERCVFELASILKEKNDVHVFASDENLELLPGVTFHKVPILKKVFFLRVLSFFFSSYFIVKKANRLVGFDIIHLHNPSLLTPDVYTLHSIHAAGIKFQESHLSWYSKFAIRLKTAHPFMLFLSKYNYFNSQHLVAISKQIKTEVLNEVKNISPQKVSIIYHGVNVKDFQILDVKIKNEIKNQIPIKTEKKVILFVANEFKRKGLDILLKALSEMKHLNDVSLIIVGDSSDGYLNTQQAKLMAQKLGIADNCIFVGRSSEVGIYFSIADLFVLPTIYEPLGMVYMEAMAAGVPVLVSIIAGMADLIDNGKDGILISNSSSELAGKMDLLFEDPEYIKQIGISGRSKIEKYTWDFAAKEYERLYFETRHKIQS